MIKAYKYRLNPTASQMEFFDRSIGCCRYVYNWALQKRVEAYQSEKRRLSAIDICKLLPELKKQEETSWLNEVSSVALQQSIRCMDTAFTKFFREHAGFPKFKSKHSSRLAYKEIGGVAVDFEKNLIKLPKIGWVKFYANQVFKGKIGTVTISKSATGKYYASILVDNGKALPAKSPICEDTAVGVDVGIKTFATLSDGSTFENPKYLEKSSARLACLQRRLARKQKGSNRRKKAKLAVAKAYEHITNQRHNFLHHVVNKIISENQTVVIEDLNVSGMLKNDKLSKSIASCSWSEFFRILSYKSDWKGVNVVRIGRFEPSSKMCECGYIHRTLQLFDRQWTCPQCHAVNDRDLLAARNIKKFGLEKQNLLTQENINKSPVVNRVGDVELSAVAGTVKRQNISVKIGI